MSVRLPSRRLVVAGVVGTLAVTSFLMTGLMADATQRDAAALTNTKSAR